MQKWHCRVTGSVAAAFTILSPHSPTLLERWSLSKREMKYAGREMALPPAATFTYSLSPDIHMLLPFFAAAFVFFLSYATDATPSPNSLMITVEQRVPPC